MRPRILIVSALLLALAVACSGPAAQPEEAVQAFFEQLEELPARASRRVGFLVQQGFHEAHHSRWLERHLARLPGRWGSQYLGVAVRGAVEGMGGAQAAAS